MNKNEQWSAMVPEQVGPVFPVVDFDPGRDRLFTFDFTGKAAEPVPEVIADVQLFTAWVTQQLRHEQARYGIGGYGENRILYASKAIFGGEEEPRSLHLGTDIWGPEGTTVYCPVEAEVHSFAFNEHFGDYGSTIILQHQAGDRVFFTLYGHLDRASLTGLTKGMKIAAGSRLAAFGGADENGHWPPHLHFQVITSLPDKDGDHPGVCKLSEKEYWLQNSPDPEFILRHTFNPHQP